MLNRPLFRVGLFTALYLLVATPYALKEHNTEFLFYIGIVIIFASLLYVMHQRIRFTEPLLWALSIWGLFHMLGGLVPVPESWPVEAESHVLYSWWLIPHYLKYDNVIHAYGFGVATWACWQSLRALVPGVRPSLGILIVCVLSGMGLGWGVVSLKPGFGGVVFVGLAKVGF
jgi:uncharacterized membrane protein YjdF